VDADALVSSFGARGGGDLDPFSSLRDARFGTLFGRQENLGKEDKPENASGRDTDRAGDQIDDDGRFYKMGLRTKS
jgi:hypothetical protein